ncbi:hypothetical protein P8452_63179 [Trifolium repens]|nr:nuclear factor Y transcription factor [Trifolium repens]WJX80141.1 hypothetical protein P8452_63179 [Trifolium repens]
MNGKVKIRASAGRRTCSSGINRRSSGTQCFRNQASSSREEWIVRGITKIHQCGLLASSNSITKTHQWAFQPNQITGAPGSVVTSLGGMQSPGRPAGAQLGQHQLAYQQQLQAFWANQYQEIKKVTEFKNHSLPWQGSRRLQRLMRMLEW